MKIVSIIRRKNGTRVPLGGRTYHFLPEAPGGEHVAEVTEQSHIDILLGIPEGYRAAGKAAKAPPAEVTPQSTEATGTSEPQSNPEDEAKAPTDPASAEAGPLTGDALKAAYREKFGRAPHYTWDEDKIREKLAEAA